MSSEQNDSTSVPFSDTKLCTNNCGFWGNPATMNLCSKCYKDICVKEQRTAAAKAAVEISLNVKPAVAGPAEASPDAPRAQVDSSASSVAVVSDGRAAAEEPKPKPGNRCGTCNKKVGLMGFKCKCGSMFCGEHRYPERHECSFDFKSAGRNAIARANPVVKADKVERF